MWIGVAGKTVFQLKMGYALMAHGTLRNGIFAPGKMLFMAIKTGNLCLMFAAVTGNCSGLVLVAFYTVGYLQVNKFRSCNLLGKNNQHCCRKDNSTQYSQ
jgi:hypothetical protein